jgi:hypothetical protein
MTEDQRTILKAYKLALSLKRDRSPKQLYELLCVLECRDLLREERREQIEVAKRERRAQLSGILG